MESGPHDAPGGGRRQGFLLKHNQQHRKANLLGSKYKRRWVELTNDTLVYAASQQELLTGRLAVFSMREMVWARPEGDTKFAVKFPERTFLFKVEAGGTRERDAWLAALKACKAAEADAWRSSSAGKQLEQLKKAAEQKLLDPTPLSSCSSPGGIAAHRPPSRPASAASRGASACGAGASSADGAFGRSSGLGGGGGGGSRPASGSLALSAPPSAAAASPRPPSPRSLLASACAGAAFVSGGGGPGAACSSLRGSAPVRSRPSTGAAAQRHSSDSDSGGGGSDMASGDDEPAPPPFSRHGGSLDLARNSLELGKACKGAGVAERPSSGGHASFSSPLPASSQRESGRAPGHRRESLTRHLTPGVMLINTSTPPTPDASAALPQAPTSSREDGAAAAAAAAGGRAQSTSAGKGRSSGVDDSGDEVLLLPASPSPQHLGQAGACRTAAAPLRPLVGSPRQPVSQQPQQKQAARQRPADSGQTNDGGDGEGFLRLSLDSLAPKPPHPALPLLAQRPVSALVQGASQPLRPCLRSSGNGGSSSSSSVGPHAAAGSHVAQPAARGPAGSTAGAEASPSPASGPGALATWDERWQGGAVGGVGALQGIAPDHNWLQEDWD